MTPPFADFELPPDKRAALRRAKRVEWTAIGFLLSSVVLLSCTMGTSQTMKATLVEDAVSLIPSIAFLLGAYYRTKPPDDRFPYGYRRAVLIAYLAGSVALLTFGLLILADSAHKLISAEHPTIQTINVFGRRVWFGWVMIAALVYSSIPPLILGRIKRPLARELYDKALQTSARLDKGDWLSGLAGVAGIVGIGYGYWWADAVVGGFISFEIVRDGYASLRNSVAQLMNKRPTDVEGKEKDPVVDRVCEEIERLGWVARARVRLREDGDVLTGEAYVVPRDQDRLLDRVADATEKVRAIDWRLYEVNVVPVRELTADGDRREAG